MRTVRKATLAALALLLAGAAVPAQAGPVHPAAAAAGPALTVDTSIGRHAIDPNIYGINFADEDLAADLRLPVRRWGGNATTRYNFTLDAYNAGHDWYFENLYYRNGTADLPAGSEADKFVEQNRRTGTETLLTVPMIGWTTAERNDACGFSIAKYGPQQGSDAQWRPDCGNGTASDGTEISGNDPTDTSVRIGPEFSGAWVRHLRETFGAADDGGVRFYNLDNEPDLWHATHRDVHPEGATYEEIRDATYATGAALKDADPGARTLGPAGWGLNSMIYSGLDQQVCSREGGSCWSDPPERAAHDGLQFAPWYLREMRAYEERTGRRVLDYFDEHIYPQQQGVALADAGDAATQELRLRSTRQLWDPSYVDESWINQPVQFIPRMRDLIDEHYPGTKVAITEYNWGALNHINGALAQADVLGIFGREGVDLATLWSPPGAGDPGAHAFRMFLNYDGKGGRFGETGVHAAGADQEKLSVYAAERGSDGALTVMVVNKTTQDLTAPVTLKDRGRARTAEVHRYSRADLTAITREADQAISRRGTFTATFPAYSITEFVVPAAGEGSLTARPPTAPPATAGAGPIPPAVGREPGGHVVR
ncbi:glycoside hydrolase family 44 protein [Streptomyces zingiberis]|uniref:Endoglucanase n=1 Tax=Streptomyces zingiberis TaxID=2053010 RepID=A0ABX1BUQ8_9ACTN|nr:glycoside hydrolase family 44 protein [Streptomyces zingiberis]NJQ00178.1 endoglucanase [Streptomyces zingiberis]